MSSEPAMPILEHLSNRIYYLPQNPEIDQPILAAVVGDWETLMVDAGPSPAHARIFLDALQQETGRGADWLVLTHWHWDHTFGLAGLSLPSIGHRHIARNLARLQGLAWDDRTLEQRVRAGDEIEFCATMIRKVYGPGRNIQVELPRLLFDRMLTIDLGGVTCGLYHAPTDHSDDAVAVYVREERTLFLGDALGPNLYAPRPYYTVEGVEKLMAWIRTFDAATMVESHSTPTAAETFWQENRILEVVAAWVRQGVAAPDTLASMLEKRTGRATSDDEAEVIELFVNGVS